MHIYVCLCNNYFLRQIEKENNNKINKMKTKNALEYKLDEW